MDRIVKIARQIVSVLFWSSSGYLLFKSAMSFYMSSQAISPNDNFGTLAFIVMLGIGFVYLVSAALIAWFAKLTWTD